MSTEQRMYRGDLIQSLISTVNVVRAGRRDLLRWYVMQNSAGNIYGREFEMHESEATLRNSVMAQTCTDYRWVLIPEKGSR